VTPLVVPEINLIKKIVTEKQLTGSKFFGSKPVFSPNGPNVSLSDMSTIDSLLNKSSKTQL
jgi:hypothetical protein